MSHDNTSEPPTPPREQLLNLLRRIAHHHDAPSSMQADARDYLRHLEAAAFGLGPVRGEAKGTGDLQSAREVVNGLPRRRRATG